VPQVVQIVVDPGNKGKGRASSTDLTSPREKQEASSESETEYAEPAPRKGTPMPGTWAEGLEARALMPQLKEIVKIDPGDEGEWLPDYGQLPKMTNIEARELFKEDTPGVTETITRAALRSTAGFNKAFVPTFGKASLTERIATTMTTPINPAYMATQHRTGAARPTCPATAGPSGGAPGGGGSGGGGPPGGGGSGGPFGIGVGAPAPAGGNGGLKGNMPSIFKGDQTKSDQFLRELNILMLTNRGHPALTMPLDHISIAISYI
jgi:hypothetical protein